MNHCNGNRYNIVTGGTDCHIVHVDLKRSPVAISGAKGELVLEEVQFIIILILSVSLSSSYNTGECELQQEHSSWGQISPQSKWGKAWYPSAYHKVTCHWVTFVPSHCYNYRGFKEADMDRVVVLIDSALKLAVEIQVNLRLTLLMLYCLYCMR